MNPRRFLRGGRARCPVSFQGGRGKEREKAVQNEKKKSARSRGRRGEMHGGPMRGCLVGG